MKEFLESAGYIEAVTLMKASAILIGTYDGIHNTIVALTWKDGLKYNVVSTNGHEDPFAERGIEISTFSKCGDDITWINLKREYKLAF